LEHVWYPTHSEFAAQALPMLPVGLSSHGKPGPRNVCRQFWHWSVMTLGAALQ
jgi:hypothetical protein